MSGYSKATLGGVDDDGRELSGGYLLVLCLMAHGSRGWSDACFRYG